MQISDEALHEALMLAAEGKSIHKIVKTLQISIKDFWEYRQIHTSFADKFAQARAEGLESNADTLLDINEEYPDVMKARLQSDNLKWLLSKRGRRTYGDALQVDVTHSVDLRGAMADARARAVRPASDPLQIPATQRSEIIDVLPQRATGSSPAANSDGENAENAAPDAVHNTPPKRRRGRPERIIELTPAERTASNARTQGAISERKFAAPIHVALDNDAEDIGLDEMFT